MEGKVVSSGHAALDPELPGGGWPCSAVTELLQAQPNVFEWRLLGPALSSLVGCGGTVLVVGPPLHPHLPGLRKHGLHEGQIVWVDVSQPAQRLWAIEQAIKANPKGAVVAWLPQARPEQIRRLQVCSQGCEGPVFLFRPAAAQAEASAAPLRLLVSLEASASLLVRVLKRRGPAHDGTVTLPALPTSLSRVLLHRQDRQDVSVLDQESGHAVLDRADSARQHSRV